MKRKDAKEIFDIPSYNKIFPFMMPKRCESLVFQPMNFEVTNTVNYVREYNKEHPDNGRIKIFYVFIAALMRTFAEREKLNSFISAKRYWLRNELSVNFVVKETFKDDSPEHSNSLIFNKNMTLSEYCKIIDDNINNARSGEEDLATDKAINFFLQFPFWVINAIVKSLDRRDKRGRAPKWLSEADGLHTSAFISNLGSIGLEGGLAHHLYEWGTTSCFITLGTLTRKKIYNKKTEKTEFKYYMNAGITLDERIADGFYFVKSFSVLQNYLSFPELLEQPPQNLPAPLLTKKQWKKKRKIEIKAKELKQKELKIQNN
ncbi:MAG: 2-oxoacid:acceptor oxidoreductase [Sphaerochaetaceae bacterium]|nr:2-oxoacid:acceptor oxidoreductase [Sphaerochaetaceae bacterium]